MRMMTSSDFRLFAPSRFQATCKAAFLALTLSAVSLSSSEAATSDWYEITGGAVRLISSGPMDKGKYQVGLEFELDQGWHTYWRYPGEAGVATVVHDQGSDNLASFRIHFPVPERYNDGFSTSIVYKGGVVLPTTVEATDPKQPVHLHFNVQFGVCKDICVPGDADLSLILSPDENVDSLSRKLIDRDAALVPHRALPIPPYIDDLALTDTAKGKALKLTAMLPKDLPEQADVDLFVEGPEGSFIGVPKFVDRTGDKAVWTLSTNGLELTDTDSRLRLVLKAGKTAVFQNETLDPKSYARRP